MWRGKKQALLVLLGYCCFGPRVLAQSDEDSDSSRPDYYDKLRNRTDLTIERALDDSMSKIFRVTLNSNSSISSAEEQVTYRLADIKTFVPFSNGTNVRQGFQNDAYTALLAAYHFNNPHLSPILTSEQMEGCDVRLTMELLDTQASPIETTRTFTRVLQRNTDFSVPEAAGVVGAYRSAVTSPLAILTGVNDIPQISPASTAVDFDVTEQYPLFGRTVASTVGEAEVALKFFQSVDASHVAVLFVTDAYGSALQKAFQDAATKANMTTDSIAFTYDIQATDIQGIVNAMEQNQYRHVYAILNENHVLPIMSALANSSMVGPDYLYIFPGIDVFALQENFATGTPANSPLVQAFNGAGFIQMSGGVTTEAIIRGEWVSAMNDGTSPLTGYENFTRSWNLSLQDDAFGEYVRLHLSDALSSIEDFDRDVPFAREPGAFRPFLYDAVTSFGLSMCRAGENSTFFDGAEIHKEFRRLDYEGSSGHVLIDSSTGTRDYNSIAFVMWNVIYDGLDEEGFAQFKFVPSQNFEGNEWIQIPGNDFIFADNTTTPPASLPEVDLEFNYIGHAARACGYVLMAIAMLLSIISLLWLVYYRDEAVVNSSQPICLMMVSAGAFIMASTIIPLSLEETIVDETGLDKACMAGPWLYVMGTCVALSALLAKTRGVYKAYRNPDLDFIHVSALDIFVTFAFMLSINFVVLITWTLVSPLEWTRVDKLEKDMFARMFDSHGTCESDGAVAFVIVIVVSNLMVLVLGNWWNYLARNIETEFGESRYIGICMAATLQAWGMGIPILVVVWENPQARFFVESGIIFVTSLAFLATMYLPKVLALRAHRTRAKDSKVQAYTMYQARTKEPSNYEEEEEDPNDDTFPKAIPDGNSVEDQTRQGAPDQHDADGRRGSGFGGRAGSIGGGIKVLHNPRTSANLMITGGLEMSREQLDFLKESEMKAEDDGDCIQEAAVEGDEDDTKRWETQESSNADVIGSAKSEEMAPGALKTFSSGSNRNNDDAKAKRGNRGSIFGGRVRFSKAVGRSEVGIKVLHNPRTSTNLTIAGGREMSREHIDHLKETLASRVEKVEEEDEEVSTKGEASQEPRKADVAP